MIKGAIFDFNGTIILDQKAQIDSWIEFVSELIGRTISEEEYYQHIHALTNKTILSYFLNRDVSVKEAEYIGNLKERKYRDLCLIKKNEIIINPGVTHLFDTLINKGIKINIATGAPYDNMQFAFALYGLDNWFDIRKIVTDDGTLPGKPEPEVYLRGLKTIECEGEECMAFEDSLTGVTSAIRAGIKEVYLVDGFNNISEAEVMVENQNIKVFKNFYEVEEYLFNGKD